MLVGLSLPANDMAARRENGKGAAARPSSVFSPRAGRRTRAELRADD
jgi:hypothetical protein